MKDEELFARENLIFVSQTCVIGSLYFRAEEDEKVYRGRIRLCHEHGPSISNRGKSEKHWYLVDETQFGAYKETEVLGGSPAYGDLVEDVPGTLAKAEGKKIYEIYGHTHKSRGNLVAADHFPEITQTHIKGLLDGIQEFADEKGKCKDRAEAANDAIITLTSGSGFPECLKQKKGVSGC